MPALLTANTAASDTPTPIEGSHISIRDAGASRQRNLSSASRDSPVLWEARAQRQFALMQCNSGPRRWPASAAAAATKDASAVFEPSQRLPIRKHRVLWCEFTPPREASAVVHTSQRVPTSQNRALCCKFTLPSGQPPALPNLTLNRTANDRPPGPVWRYAVHFRQPGPGALPSAAG